MKKSVLYWFIAASFSLTTIYSCKKSDDPAPVASYTYTVNDLSITFTNNSTNASTYTWNFGDGGTSTDKSPTHTYAKAGKYVVTLTTGSVNAKQNVTVSITCKPRAGNLIVGGTMEKADAASWTTFTTYEAGKGRAVTYSFGDTTQMLSASYCNGKGALFISSADTNSDEGSVFYQKISKTLNKGDSLSFSMDVVFAGKKDGKATKDGYASNYWFQMYLSSVEPIANKDNADGFIAGSYDYVGAKKEINPITGSFLPYGNILAGAQIKPTTYDVNGASTPGDATGGFRVKATGTYFLVIKMGRGKGGSYGTPGLTIDNVALVPVP